ncbi:MAG: hypothetical protein H6Q73_4266 [Firmicutes bacterium]|nr:hypothetical protein [Bacillota bacterium]
MKHHHQHKLLIRVKGLLKIFDFLRISYYYHAYGDSGGRQTVTLSAFTSAALN